MSRLAYKNVCLILWLAGLQQKHLNGSEETPTSSKLQFKLSLHYNLDFPGGSDGKVSAYYAEDPGSIPGLGRSLDLLEKEMATHSSILAWKIPWTEEPGRLQSMGSQRVRRLSDFAFTFFCMIIIGLSLMCFNFF